MEQGNKTKKRENTNRKALGGDTGRGEPRRLLGTALSAGTPPPPPAPRSPCC